MPSPNLSRCTIRAIDRDWKAALDPAFWAESIKFNPDDWQAEVLRSRSDRVLLNCSRQSGKSATAALLGLHAATYTPDSLILLLSPSLRQSGELFRKVLDRYGATGGGKPKAESALRLELDNGSRLVSLPGKEATIRGYSGVKLLIIDEAARVPDELYFAVRPMLAVSGGRMMALSTPYGKRGWWSREWDEGEGWHRVKVTAEQCPRISAAFLVEEKKHMGEWWFNQEYMCEFMDAETAAFTYDDVQEAFAEKVESWDL